MQGPIGTIDISEHFGIGALSKRTSVKVETIRYYEREGLLPKPMRTSGGHRSYSFDDLRRLTFIRRARELGFTTGDIRELLGLVDGRAYTCREVRSVTLEHAEQIQRKISDLQRMRTTLLSISSQCEGGSVPECPVIDALFALKEDWSD